MLEPQLHPGFLDWVRDRGRGDLPAESRSAISAAIEAAYRGVFDPRDIEARFHSFETESRLRGARSRRRTRLS